MRPTQEPLRWFGGVTMRTLKLRTYTLYSTNGVIHQFQATKALAAKRKRYYEQFDGCRCYWEFNSTIRREWQRLSEEWEKCKPQWVYDSETGYAGFE